MNYPVQREFYQILHELRMLSESLSPMTTQSVDVVFTKGDLITILHAFDDLQFKLTSQMARSNRIYRHNETLQGVIRECDLVVRQMAEESPAARKIAEIAAAALGNRLE